MNLKQLKEKLKTLALNIRLKKVELKNFQRDNNGYQGDHLSDLLRLKHNFRHKHIAYCLTRGIAYETIENPRKGNEPNWSIIQEIQNACTENVRAHAE